MPKSKGIPTLHDILGQIVECIPTPLCLDYIVGYVNDLLDNRARELAPVVLNSCTLPSWLFLKPLPASITTGDEAGMIGREKEEYRRQQL